jgi:hypothetical protein
MSESGVNDLLDAVTRLPPRALNEFEERLARWKLDSTSDAALIRATKRRLPAADGARLRTLIERSEAGRLSSEDAEQSRTGSAGSCSVRAYGRSANWSAAGASRSKR